MPPFYGLKMEAACSTEKLYLTASPHSTTTQKTNVDNLCSVSYDLFMLGLVSFVRFRCFQTSAPVSAKYSTVLMMSYA
jgi:hypothetical protein